jgi:hypothetical protein
MLSGYVKHLAYFGLLRLGKNWVKPDVGGKDKRFVFTD